MNNIAVTGFYGTGSSAIVDLLSEHHQCTSTFDYEYEHVALYNPGGLFDLEWKLLYNNDLHRSNEALRTFQTEMRRLNDSNFGWFGSYKKLYGEKFNQICVQLVDSLVDYTTHLHSYADYERVRFSLLKLVLQVGAKLLQGRKIHEWGRQYVFKRDSQLQMVSMPSKEKFNEVAKVFTSAYADMVATNHAKNIIFDHLVLPQHLNRVNDFFDEKFKFICADRDPRDLFVLSKYIWKSQPAFPTSVKEFCDEFRVTRNIDCSQANTRLMRVNFEDLIYHNAETVDKICGFCGIDPSDFEVHKRFRPESSINNTQNFLLQDDWREEIQYIEENLKEYIYDFPYTRVPVKKEMFE